MRQVRQASQYRTHPHGLRPSGIWQGLPAPLASRHSETLQGADLLKLDDDTNKAPPAEARGSLEGTAQSAELAWLQLAATSGTLAPWRQHNSAGEASEVYSAI